MLRSYIREEAYDQAIELCEKQKTAVRENRPLLAYIEYLQGNVFFAKKDLNGAKRHLEKAVEILKYALWWDDK